MDSLLASLGRVMEGLPLAILIPVLVVGVVAFAWFRADRMEKEKKREDSGNVHGSLREIRREIEALHNTLSDIKTGIEILKDRHKR